MKYRIDFPSEFIPANIEILVAELEDSNNRRVGRLASAAIARGEFSIGLIEAVKTAIQNYNRVNQVPSRSAHEIRTEWILQTRDSDGKARARKF